MDKNSPKYFYRSSGGRGYVECGPGMILDGEEKALELVAYCGEKRTSCLLAHGENLPADFFDLSTGLAGGILLKFTNYRIILAAVIAPEQIGSGRFSEMVRETNRGSEFRVFSNRSEAVKWLMSQEQRHQYDQK